MSAVHFVHLLRKQTTCGHGRGVRLKTSRSTTVANIMSNVVRSLSPLAANVSTDISKKYEEAVKTLNTLQSNAQTLQRIRQQRDKLSHLNIPNMVKYAERVGISLDDIDSLNVIHVSGTKGKGSTCAFTESILRHYGYKTGFFSSPHLVEVRERFCINGSQLSREKFAHYFWDVYSKLEASKDQHNGAMPAYFAFCTIMAIHVFLQEKIDVAIVEVGIGGAYDSTNLIRKPVVCGVTSLGLDHVSILGNTIEKIAWHKAGIFKPGVPAFTAPQVAPALSVLLDRAKEIGSPLHKVLPPRFLNPQGRQFDLGIEGAMQKENAALALQLSKTWMEESQKNKKGTENGADSPVSVSVSNGYDQDFVPECEAVVITEEMCQGLSRCRWAGRNQSIKKQHLTYYLDGAHTLESIQQCVDWFQTASAQEAKTIRGKLIKVIVFNTTGDRDPSILIAPLIDCQFDMVAFCPNIAFSGCNTADLTNNTVTTESQHSRCVLNMESWIKLQKSSGGQWLGDKDCNSSNEDADKCINGQANGTTKKRKVDSSHDHENLQTSIEYSTKVNQSDSVIYKKSFSSSNHASPDCDNNQTNTTCVFPSIYDALKWATQGRDPLVQDELAIDQYEKIPKELRDPAHIQVLVTGSLHLVGGVLRAIGPEYN